MPSPRPSDLRPITLEGNEVAPRPDPDPVLFPCYVSREWAIGLSPGLSQLYGGALFRRPVARAVSYLPNQPSRSLLRRNFRRGAYATPPTAYPIWCSTVSGCYSAQP